MYKPLSRYRSKKKPQAPCDKSGKGPMLELPDREDLERLKYTQTPGDLTLEQLRDDAVDAFIDDIGAGKKPSIGNWGQVIDVHSPLIAPYLSEVARIAQKRTAPFCLHQSRVLPLFLLADLESITLSVEDNGVGMSEPTLNARRGGSIASARRGAHGRGMRFVHRGCEEHGCRLGTQATPDQGTRFSVQIPRLQSAS